MLRSIQALCLGALMGLLAACGGSSGGGGSDNTPDPTQGQPCPTQVSCGAGDELCGRTYNSISLIPKAFLLTVNQVIFRGESEGACAEPHPDVGRNVAYNYASFPYEILGNGLGLEIDGKVELLGAYKGDGTVVALGVEAPGQTDPGLTIMFEQASGLTIHDILNTTYSCAGAVFTGISEWIELTGDLPSDLNPASIVTDWPVSGRLIFGPSSRDVEFIMSGRTVTLDGQAENGEFYSFSPESGMTELREDGYLKFPLSDEFSGAEGFVDQTLDKLIVRSITGSSLARFLLICQKEGAESPVPNGTFLKTFIRRKARLFTGDSLIEYEYSTGVSEINFTESNTLSRRDLNVTNKQYLDDVTSFFDQELKWFDADASGFIDEDLDTLVPGNNILLRNENFTYLRINDAANEIIERRMPDIEVGKLPDDYDFLYEIGIGLGI